jgi:hypothetical protein
MTQTARLITPDGETIDLPADLYLQVKGLLEARQQHKTPSSRAKMEAAIQRGYGLVAGGDSLTAALLKERAAERARENAKLSFISA